MFGVLPGILHANLCAFDWNHGSIPENSSIPLFIFSYRAQPFRRSWKGRGRKVGCILDGGPWNEAFCFHLCPLQVTWSLTPPFVFLSWNQQAVDGNYTELGPRVGAAAGDVMALLTSFSKRRWLSQTPPFLQLRRGPFQVWHGALCPPRCLSG